MNCRGSEDMVKLKEDIGRLGCLARGWGIRFQPVKCNIMQITRKQIKKINASYTLEGMVLDNIENIKYLVITITNDLKWNTHQQYFAQRPVGPLGSLDITWWHVPRMLQSLHTRDWCVQALSMVV